MHPPSFICPLTMEVMQDPVMDHCAHNFERRAIHHWLQTQGDCCPISRKPLHTADLIPNHRLAERIERWQWQCASGAVDWEGTRPAEENDDDDESDIERASRSVGRTKRATSTKKQQRKLPCAAEPYESLPKMDLMLLPQERLLLDKVRLQNETEQILLRKSACCRRLWWTLMVLCLVGIVLTGGAWYWKRLPEDTEPENP